MATMMLRKKSATIRALFVDIGGVLLSNGWDHQSPRSAAKTFGLKADEFEARHQMNYATYEEGKMTLAEYLGRVVFYVPRDFTRAQFRPSCSRRRSRAAG